MIYGERIRFRAPERSDIPLWVAWLNDPEVLQGLGLYKPMSTASEEKWFESLSARSNSDQVFVIEARLADDQEGWKPIGNVGLHDIEWRVRSAEFGIVIGEKSLWNQGYGTEATRLILHYGFYTLNLNRIFLRVYQTNPRAIRAYEKAGFVHKGCMRQAEFREGRYIDVLYLSVLKAEYKG